jgi:hypothetical protein
MNKETPVIFNVHDIPPGWAILVDPPTMIVPPGSYQWVNFMAYPSGAPGEDNPDEKKYQPGFIGKPKIEALVPYADTFISIGGVDLWAHLVESTKLTVEATIAKQQAKVSGKVIPAIANATIAVELISGDKRELRHTKTDERGDYSLSLDASISGISTVQAFYSGDMTYAAAESDLLQIDTTKD